MSVRFIAQRRHAMSEELRNAIRIGERVHEAVRADAARSGLFGALCVFREKSGFRRVDRFGRIVDNNFSPEVKEMIRNNKEALKMYAAWYDHQTVDESPVICVGRKKSSP